MATSTNYGWAEPDNTSLVKDGAQAIRTLGDAIDTSLWNSGYGQAGKNKIINGDFGINQRNTTSTTSDATFLADRWFTTTSDGTCTYTIQTFTPGAAPVAGYESKNYLRIVTSGQTLTSALTRLDQKIEDVRTFAGQTITVSFWAQAGTGTPSIAVELQQNFGTGGSPSATVNTLIASPAKQAITTSWVRYSYTIAIPSISGKTLGTNNNSFLLLGIIVSAGSNFNARTGSLGIQSNTFNIWGVQVEYGSKATPFQTASGGSIQGELAMCQRYYYRTSDTGTFANYGIGYADQSNSLYASVKLPVSMRVKPTSLDYSSLAAHIYNVSATSLTTVTLESGSLSRDWGVVLGSTTGLTQFRPYGLNNNNTTSGYIGFSAEL